LTEESKKRRESRVAADAMPTRRGRSSSRTPRRTQRPSFAGRSRSSSKSPEKSPSNFKGSLQQPSSSGIIFVGKDGVETDKSPRALLQEKQQRLAAAKNSSSHLLESFGHFSDENPFQSASSDNESNVTSRTDRNLRLKGSKSRSRSRLRARGKSNEAKNDWSGGLFPLSVNRPPFSQEAASTQPASAIHSTPSRVAHKTVTSPSQPKRLLPAMKSAKAGSLANVVKLIFFLLLVPSLVLLLRFKIPYCSLNPYSPGISGESGSVLAKINVFFAFFQRNACLNCPQNGNCSADEGQLVCNEGFILRRGIFRDYCALDKTHLSKIEEMNALLSGILSFQAG
jgi:hypothetical protein